MNLIRFFIILSAFILLNFYVFIRGWQALPVRTTGHILYTFVFMISALSVFISVFLGNSLPDVPARIFEYLGGFYVVLFIFFVAGALLGDILRAANHLFGIFPAWIHSNYAQVKFLYFVFVLVTLCILCLIGYTRFSNPQVVELEINTGNSNSNTRDLTIVAASDLHLGNVIRKNRLAKWVELINSQKPDIILLAGDLFDHSYKAIVSQNMDQELSKLQAPQGVYAITGNHEYYTGIDRVLDFLKRSGISVLRDQWVTIDDRLLIIGRDDMTSRSRKLLATLMDSVPHHLPAIVLDHQPQAMVESIQQGIDLHISGHTHNGQIFPYNLLVSMIYQQGYGYRKTGKTHIYVSSGLGLWGAPIRLGTQSEIVKIKLKLQNGNNP
jgi:hypothetical protein